MKLYNHARTMSVYTTTAVVLANALGYSRRTYFFAKTLCELQLVQRGCIYESISQRKVLSKLCEKVFSQPMYNGVPKVPTIFFHRKDKYIKHQNDVVKITKQISHSSQQILVNWFSQRISITRITKCVIHILTAIYRL